MKNLTFVSEASGNANKVPKRCSSATSVCCDGSFTLVPLSTTPSYRPDVLTLPPNKVGHGEYRPCNNNRQYGTCQLECPKDNRIRDTFAGDSYAEETELCGSGGDLFCCSRVKKDRCRGQCLATCPDKWSEEIPQLVTTTTPNYGAFVIEEKFSQDEPLCWKKEERCCIPENDNRGPQNSLGDKVTIPNLKKIPQILGLAKILFRDDD